MTERSAQLVLRKRASKAYRALERLESETDGDWVHIDDIGSKLKEANETPSSILALEQSLDKPSTWTDDVIATVLTQLENKDVVDVKQNEDEEYVFKLSESNNLWIPYPLKSTKEDE